MAKAVVTVLMLSLMVVAVALKWTYGKIVSIYSRVPRWTYAMSRNNSFYAGLLSFTYLTKLAKRRNVSIHFLPKPSLSTKYDLGIEKLSSMK